MTHEQVMENEDFILTDSDVHNHLHRDWYAQWVYEARDFKELDVAMLMEVAEYTRQTEGWLSQPNVYAVPNVFAEIYRFKEILRDKVSALERAYRNMPQRLRMAEDEHASERRQAGKAVLSSICFSYVNATRLARKGMFMPSDREFEVLEDAVMAAAMACDSKRDSSVDCLRGRSAPSDLHADEQLVAAALYRSFFEDKPSCIVTPDSDIARLLIDSCNYIEEMFLDGARLATRALEKNPVRVYFLVPQRSQRIFRLQVDTAHSISLNYCSCEGH